MNLTDSEEEDGFESDGELDEVVYVCAATSAELASIKRQDISMLDTGSSRYISVL